MAEISSALSWHFSWPTGFGVLFQTTPFPTFFPFPGTLNLLWPILPIWSLIFYVMELYRYWRGPGFWRETWRVFKAVFLSCFVLGFIIFALKYQFISRIFLLSFAFFDLASGHSSPVLVKKRDPIT